jgi:hypothetical protein
MNEEIQELITLENENAVILNGFDEAILGMTYAFGKEPVVAYSINKILETLIKDGMTLEDAQEYFEYNILNAYFAEHNPVFLNEFKE